VEAEAERAAAVEAGVEPWPGGERELFVRIAPSRVTGRRIRPALWIGPGPVTSGLGPLTSLSLVTTPRPGWSRPGAIIMLTLVIVLLDDPPASTLLGAGRR